MLEGSNSKMVQHMKKNDKSFNTLHKKNTRPNRRSSLMFSNPNDVKVDDDAFSKLYNSKAAASYRKQLTTQIAKILDG